MKLLFFSFLFAYIFFYFFLIVKSFFFLFSNPSVPMVFIHCIFLITSLFYYHIVFSSHNFLAFFLWFCHVIFLLALPLDRHLYILYWDIALHSFLIVTSFFLRFSLRDLFIRYQNDVSEGYQKYEFSLKELKKKRYHYSKKSRSMRRYLLMVNFFRVAVFEKSLQKIVILLMQLLKKIHCQQKVNIFFYDTIHQSVQEIKNDSSIVDHSYQLFHKNESMRWVFFKKKPLIVHDVCKEIRCHVNEKNTFVSFCAIPLIFDASVLGIIAIQFEKKTDFSDEYLSFFDCFSGLIVQLLVKKNFLKK